MHSRFVRFLVAWVILAVAVMITFWIFPGLEADWHPGLYLLFGAVFSIINLLLGTVLRILSLPIMVVTLGLFGVVINSGLFLLTGWLFDDVEVTTLWAALGGAVCISIVRAGLIFLVDRRS